MTTIQRDFLLFFSDKLAKWSFVDSVLMPTCIQLVTQLTQPLRQLLKLMSHYVSNKFDSVRIYPTLF